MATIDLGALKDKAAAETYSEPIEVEAAFIVVVRPGGVIQASPDINAPIVPAREISIEEMQMACRRVADDIQATKTAQLVQMGMQQTAAAAFSAAEGSRIAKSLKL
jgi:hypothetical protein